MFVDILLFTGDADEVERMGEAKRDFVQDRMAMDRAVQLPRFPSSKTCSACGHVLEMLPLDVREWDCPVCGTHHDRDVNAARNLPALPGQPGRLPPVRREVTPVDIGGGRLQPVPVDEAGTFLDKDTRHLVDICP